MKLADITPVHKKEDSTIVKSCRTFSVILTKSKILEKLMQNKLINTLTSFCLLFSLVTEKDLVHKMF